MATNNFTETTEIYQKNVGKAMKWLQEITTTVVETQNKQMKLANELYSKAMNVTLEGINKNNFNSSFGLSETVVEILKKNMETISEMSKATLKTALDYSQQSYSEPNSKDTIASIITAYNKQIEDITSINKKSFESLTKHFETTKPFFDASITEKLKSEFESNVKLSKGQIETIINSYKKVTNPTFETNQKILDQLNKQMESSLDANLKLWSELTDSLISGEKTVTPKKDNTLFDVSLNGSGTNRKSKEITSLKK